MADKVRLKDISEGRSDLFKLAPKDINRDPKWNERDHNEKHKEHIEELAISIAELGVLQPVTVCMKDGKVWLTDGFCRMEAVDLAISRGADIKTVKAQVEERHSNEADHVLTMLTRNSGKPFTASEQARVVKRLLGFGWTEEEIRKKTGRSTTHMKNLEMINGAPEDVKQLLADGKVSLRLTLKLLREKGSKAGEAIKKEVEKAAAKGKGKATGRTQGNVRQVSWLKHVPLLVKFIKELAQANEENLGALPEAVADKINEANDYITDNELSG